MFYCLSHRYCVIGMKLKLWERITVFLRYIPNKFSNNKQIYGFLFTFIISAQLHDSYFQQQSYYAIIRITLGTDAVYSD